MTVMLIQSCPNLQLIWRRGKCSEGGALDAGTEHLVDVASHPVKGGLQHLAQDADPPTRRGKVVQNVRTARLKAVSTISPPGVLPGSRPPGWRTCTFLKSHGMRHSGVIFAFCPTVEDATPRSKQSKYLGGLSHVGKSNGEGRQLHRFLSLCIYFSRYIFININMWWI